LLKQEKGELLQQMRRADEGLNNTMLAWEKAGWIVGGRINEANSSLSAMLSIRYIMPDSYKGGRILNFLVGKYTLIQNKPVALLETKTAGIVSEFLATFAGGESELLEAIRFYYMESKQYTTDNRGRMVFMYAKRIPALLDDKLLLNNLLYNPIKPMSDYEL